MRTGRLDAKWIAGLEERLQEKRKTFQQGLAAGLRMPNGSDPGYGHGENAREIIIRVETGQKPVDAIIGATSLAAESLGLDETIGTLVAGDKADIIAVAGRYRFQEKENHGEHGEHGEGFG